MTESFETEHQKFVENYKAEQRRLLIKFIERHQSEDLPALDFTEEEAKIFVPEKLLTTGENNSEKIVVKIFTSAKKESCTIFVEDADGNRIIDFSFQNKVESFGDRNDKKNSVLYVVGYSDCKLIRGKGVTADFYRNLNTVAAKIGFKVVVGENSFHNIDYFVKKLGRYPEAFLLGRENIDPQDGLADQDYCLTYGFLDPNDAERFVRPEYFSDQRWRDNMCDILWPPFDLETGHGCTRYEKYRRK